MSNSEPVGVRVLDREYTVGVSAEERDGLLAAARLLDARMRELRGNNRMVALDRIAVLAALNLAHEVQQLRALGEQLLLLLAQAAVLVGQALAALDQRFHARGQGAELGDGVGRIHGGHDRQRPCGRSSGEAAQAGTGTGRDRKARHSSRSIAAAT